MARSGALLARNPGSNGPPATTAGGQSSQGLATLLFKKTQRLGPSKPPKPPGNPQELELYKRLKHRHVVGYIDATFEPRSNTLFIFLEYVPGGFVGMSRPVGP